jgi:hypothetical protein
MIEDIVRGSTFHNDALIEEEHAIGNSFAKPISCVTTIIVIPLRPG